MPATILKGKSKKAKGKSGDAPARGTFIRLPASSSPLPFAFLLLPSF
jgi:hypothetical protein